MVSRSKKSFLKRNQKTILLVTVILGVLYFGLPYLTMSGYTLDGVVSPADMTASNGEFADLVWMTSDGSYWSDAWWGYMIYVDGSPAFAEPSNFEYSDITTVISYTFRLENYEPGSIIEVTLEMWEDPDGESTASDSVLITIEGTITESEYIPTTTSSSSNSPMIDGMDDMEIIYIMAMAGGAIFLLAVVATFIRR